MEVRRAAGKHVSMVRSTAPRVVRGEKDTDEKLRLEKYRREVKTGRGLVSEYDSREDLASQVEHVLSSQAEMFLREVAEPTVNTPAGGHLRRGVWPRVE